MAGRSGNPAPIPVPLVPVPDAPTPSTQLVNHLPILPQYIWDTIPQELRNDYIEAVISSVPRRPKRRSVGEGGEGNDGNITQAGDAEMSNTAFKRPRIETGNREQVESVEPSSRGRRRRESDTIRSNPVSQAKKARDQINNLRKQYSDPEELCKRLSDPSLMTRLPFPFPGRGKPTERFTILDGGDWFYMGREYFTILRTKVTQLMSSETKELSLYGTIGYGKSHLLAALVCYLTIDGKRVVYIPDCRQCCKTPFVYFRAAMLFTWADDRKVQEDIMRLESMEDIYYFFEDRQGILFIVDQINALDLEDKAGDTINDDRKNNVRKWIDEFASDHQVIYSASANYQARVRMDAKQTNDIKLYVYGGFSTSEMQQWWIRNEDALPHKDKPDDLKTFKSEVEDITGCIPLLLDKCIMEGKINLSAPKLNEVFDQVQQFMWRIHDLKDHSDAWEQHGQYVTACITNEQPPGDLPREYIDHRYFYVEDGKARYACGIAREAAARQLRKHKMTAFANRSSLAVLEQYIHNPSVTGFFIEQAVLSSIAIQGLAIRDVHGPVHQEMFHTTYPQFDTSRKGWVLYCPMKFNYPAIDAILVHFTEDGEDNSGGKKKCLMYPIQVTVAKSHADSEEGFLNHWKDWTRNLDDYDIEVEFCWITPDQELTLQVVPSWSRSLRSENILRPPYKTTRISLEEVNKEIWSKYQRVKELSTHVTD